MIFRGPSDQQIQLQIFWKESSKSHHYPLSPWQAFFLPAGCLLMWKQAHFTFKSTSVFAWIKFLLQLAKSEWPQGFTNKYVCYVFIILNTKICKHKSYLLKNKTRNTSKMGKKNSNTNHRFKDYSFLVCQLYHLM